MNGNFLIIALGGILRIIAVIYCVNRAQKNKNNVFLWGFLAVFFPLIAIVAIQFIKTITIKPPLQSTIERPIEVIEIQNLGKPINTKKIIIILIIINLIILMFVIVKHHSK